MIKIETTYYQNSGSLRGNKTYIWMIFFTQKNHPDYF